MMKYRPVRDWCLVAERLFRNGKSVCASRSFSKNQLFKFGQLFVGIPRPIVCIHIRFWFCHVSFLTSGLLMSISTGGYGYMPPCFRRSMGRTATAPRFSGTSSSSSSASGLGGPSRSIMPPRQTRLYGLHHPHPASHSRLLLQRLRPPLSSSSAGTSSPHHRHLFFDFWTQPIFAISYLFDFLAIASIVSGFLQKQQLL